MGQSSSFGRFLKITKCKKGFTWGKGGYRSPSLENTSPNLPWFSRRFWGGIQLGIFNAWIQQSGLYLIHCFTVESLECPFILASIMIFLKQSGFPNLERHWKIIQRSFINCTLYEDKILETRKFFVYFVKPLPNLNFDFDHQICHSL